MNLTYDEELGGRSPLFRPSENTAQSRSFEQKRSSIAENFERKQVNPPLFVTADDGIADDFHSTSRECGGKPCPA